MRLLIIGGVFVLCMYSWDASAQSTREAETPTTDKQFSKKKAASRAFKKKEDQALVEYEALMKENKKKYKKQAREMKKPQYSDPAYFGHKRPPKKRRLGKRKFCKECGIVH